MEIRSSNKQKVCQCQSYIFLILLFMGDLIKSTLSLPSWQIPYLEKHRIFELFHELSRELVIHQPDDHVLFLKQILMNAIRKRDSVRVIVLPSLRVNYTEVARLIADVIKENIITDEMLLAYCGSNKIRNSCMRAKCIAHLINTDPIYANGWILIDCIKSEKDAKALLRLGVLPTHVLFFIPNFWPDFNELLYCRVPLEWPEFRRNLAELRDVFKTPLREIHLEEKSLDEVITEAVNILNVKPATYFVCPRVLIMGPRGSGRKTQANILVEQLNLVHIDFERLICEVWMSYSELGQKMRKCKDDVCLHSELLAEVIHKRVLQKDCLSRGWVLTGFPFSKRDFEYLDCIYTPPNRVIFLECNLPICKDRVFNRQTNVLTGSVIALNETEAKKEMPNFKRHPKDSSELIDAELSYYCENYGDLKKYCGETAYFINGEQNERWIYEEIAAILARRPLACQPRKPFKSTTESNSTISGSDNISCCCSPVPSQIIDNISLKI